MFRLCRWLCHVYGMFIFLITAYRAIIFAVATDTTIFWGLGRHYRSLISLSFLDRMGIRLCIDFLENTGNRRRSSAIDVTLLSGLGKLLKWGLVLLIVCTTIGHLL